MKIICHKKPTQYSSTVSDDAAPVATVCADNDDVAAAVAADDDA